MNSYSVTLPMPPSTNNMFVNVAGRGRVKSKAYRAWSQEAGWIAKTEWQRQGCPKFEGPLSVTIHMGLRFDADLSNRIKACEDILVKSIPDFPDDCWNDRLEVERVPEIEGVRIMVLQMAPRAKAA